MQICILVLNNATVDSRIFQQAETFAEAGHDVFVLATDNGGVPPVESRNGYVIRRVRFNPTWPEKFPRAMRLVGRRPKPPVDESPRPGPRPPRPAAIILPGSVKRLTISEWLRWLTTGKGRPPRSWPGGDARASARLKFVLSILWRLPEVWRSKGAPLRRYVRRRFLHHTLGRYRRLKKRVQRYSRGKILGPDFLRQIEARLEAEAVTHHPDLVWANDAETLRPGALAARRSGARLVYDAHEAVWDAVHVTPERQRYWTEIERTYINEADARFTVCEPIASELASRYSIPRPVVLLNTPPLRSSRVSRDASPLNEHRRPGEQLVLFHGAMAAHRGLEQLLQSMTILSDRHRLIFLGYGGLRKSLEEDVESRGLADRVTFLDAVPPEELLSWVAGADVGVIPYQRVGKNHEYSTPNKLFQCMHAGVPVVVNTLPEMERIVTEVGFGIATDCSDPAAIAKAINELTSDPDRWSAAHEAALVGSRRYCWEAQEPAILAVLDDVPA